MSQALTADLVHQNNHDTALGMWNLVAEIGAVQGLWSAEHYAMPPEAGPPRSS